MKLLTSLKLTEITCLYLPSAGIEDMCPMPGGLCSFLDRMFEH